MSNKMDRIRKHSRRPAGRWLKQALSLPGAALAYATGKWQAMSAASSLAAEAVPLQLSAAGADRLIAALSKGLAAAGGQPAGPPDWSEADEALINQIRDETKTLNRNNVTRTEAYRIVYFRTPELHWSLLAHLVSRNGGWNMTDLQGEWIPRLLDNNKREAVFQFLERSNALIFQDVYPQLRLYELSLREGRPLFHLLPAFGVSSFMKPVWKQFWKERDPILLTVAIIINEQNYVEQRVVQNANYQKTVLHTLFYGLQSLLQLNGVLFPYGQGGELHAGSCDFDEPSAAAAPSLSMLQSPDNGARLAGLILENFDHLEERIEFGKRLYAILFGIPRIYEGVRCFAAAVKHTGSRADYAPGLFARVRQKPPEKIYRERLAGGRLKEGAAPIYSPELQSAWPDQRMEPAEQGDWFHNVDQVKRYFHKLPLPRQFEITNEYGMMLHKLELAVITAQIGK